jgi:hypothetical protein
LIEQCNQLDKKYPTPITDKQAWTLRQAGISPDGRTKREAQRIISQLNAGGRRRR